jgi:hypothetical protein
MKGIDMPKQKTDISTSALLNRLFKTSKLKSFIDSYDEAFIQTPFCDYIKKLCTDKKLVCEHVIKKSGIDRTYGHQLFSGLRQPSRDKVIQLAFGLLLDVNEAQELLKAAGKSTLYPKIKRDAVIMYCLKRQMGFMDLQALLHELSLPPVGMEGRYE